MDRRTRENFLYVAEELRSHLWKPCLLIVTLSTAGVGLVWGFYKVDAYLTPAFATEKTFQGETLIGLKEAHIRIPKIGVEAPITFVNSVDPEDFLEPLKRGVVHYPSALPGQQGVSVILGHSAPFGWFGNTYDAIFSNVKDLKPGDTVSVIREGKLYTYEVSGKTFLRRGQDIPEEVKKSERPLLVLLSCWPPGINNKRIMIQAEMI